MKELDFSKYRKLKKLSKGFRSMIHLKILKMWEYDTLEEFLSGLPNFVALEELNFSKYRKLKKLPEGFRSLICLKKLFM